MGSKDIAQVLNLARQAFYPWNYHSSPLLCIYENTSIQNKCLSSIFSNYMTNRHIEEV